MSDSFIQKVTNDRERFRKALKIIRVIKSCSFLIATVVISGFLFILGFLLVIINDRTRGGLKPFFGMPLIVLLILIPLFVLRYFVPILGLDIISYILLNWRCISDNGIEILGEKEIKALALRLSIIAIIFAGLPIFYSYSSFPESDFWGYMIIPVLLIVVILGMAIGSIAFILYSKTSAKLFGCLFSALSFLSANVMAAFIFRQLFREITQ
jgi:hypothetical protein